APYLAAVRGPACGHEEEPVEPGSAGRARVFGLARVARARIELRHVPLLEGSVPSSVVEHCCGDLVAATWDRALAGRSDVVYLPECPDPPANAAPPMPRRQRWSRVRGPTVPIRPGRRCCRPVAVCDG